MVDNEEKGMVDNEERELWTTCDILFCVLLEKNPKKPNKAKLKEVLLAGGRHQNTLAEDSFTLSQTMK